MPVGSTRITKPRSNAVRVALQILTLVVLATVPASAMSAEFAGAGSPQNLRWRTPVIRLAVATSLISQNPSIKADADVIGALKRSVAQWQSVTGLEFRIESTDRQSVSPMGSVGDG